METPLACRNDDNLLAAFVNQREEAAFAEVVRRHGGVVMAVCRSVLGNSADAEDAAQAVFLTLAQKASSRHVQMHLVGWLHRVAWYVATRAAEAKAIRRGHEQEAARMKHETIAAESEPMSLALLQAGLVELPEKYRVPLLLHHFEGRTQEETAALLGCGVSAVAMRLNRGRQLLRERLGKRGVGVTAAGLVAVLAGQASASVPPAFVAVAARAAAAVLAKQLTACAVISASTLTLSKGAMNMLYWAKLKLVASVAVAVVLAGGAVGTYVAVTHAAQPSPMAAKTEEKQTITGIAKALPAYNPNKPDPAIANATVTVTVNGADTVYQVFGWGGIICAKNDGKTVEVTGKVRKTTAGQMTILAASVNVKVIVVK